MHDDPLIGRQLANFLIEEPIGRGGMAQVYYAQDVKLERPVAIKVIDVRHRGNPAYAERFVREAQTVAKWRHENIIHIYYTDDEDALYYFVMEYIDGKDLRQLLTEHQERDELMPHELLLNCMRPVAEALDYAHEQGVIHRDVKPSNIMVEDESERVILMDFGLALDVAQGTMGEAFGSSRYMAPEQAQSSAGAVPQSDLYSLAVILYEMLTGSVPFDDPSPTAVAIQHITLEPQPLRKLNPDLSEGVEAVILKALSKEPEERYQTGVELLDALEKALSQPAPVVSAEKSLLELIDDDDEDDPAETEPDTATSETPAAETEPAPLEEILEPPPPEPDEDDLIGKQLDEYQLEAMLGQGGMARVYRGLDIRLNRPVAIKVIQPHVRTDEDYIVRFEREAQAVAQLDHSGIVTVYRFGEVDGVLYIAMKYIEGQNLDEVMAQYRQQGEMLPIPEMSRIVRQIALALDYSHAQGVIHRDIKPSNIMMDREGRIILTDFGLALLIEVGTRGEIFGSPHYISPEQAVSSAGAVPQSDLYSLGVIIYQMLTGRLPFHEEDPLDVAMHHISTEPEPPSSLNPDVSPDIDAVLLRALCKEPEDRFPSGEAFAAALDEAWGLPPEQSRVNLTKPAPRSEPSAPAQDVVLRPVSDSDSETATSEGEAPRSRPSSVEEEDTHPKSYG